MLLADAKPVAALPAVEDEDMETLELSVDSKFLDLTERSRRRRKMVAASPSTSCASVWD
jgi:hypothetical protein